MTIQPNTASSGLRIPQEDLDFVVNSVGSRWSLLRNQRIFMTGGTGFVGKWLLATFLEANERFKLSASVTLLSRNPKNFLDQYPLLQYIDEIDWIEGDVRTFSLIDSQDYRFFIHAATDVARVSTPSQVFDDCDLGTRNVLDVARKTRSKKRFLLLSSGAVYRSADSGLVDISEDWHGAPSSINPHSSYAEGKRVSELLCAMMAEEDADFEFSIARCFSFVGPHLPLNKQFAIGNFIHAAVMNKDLKINGDGTPIRSYLYAADLAYWLWVILFQAKNKSYYNVGGEEALSISQLASRVNNCIEGKRTIVSSADGFQGDLRNSYVPNINKIFNDLALKPQFALDESIKKTAVWAIGSKKNEL